MASPRQQFRYDEASPNWKYAFPTASSLVYEEAPAKGSTHIDEVVKVNANGEVLLCADGDEFLGVLELIRRGVGTTPVGTATVQTKGPRLLKCASGATFTLGQRVVADGNGGVKAAAGAAGTGRAWFKQGTTLVLVEL